MTDLNPDRYSPREQAILNRFFTNLDKPIYCVTDEMPQELWALLAGAYSRTHLTMRDNLLRQFKDTLNKDLKDRGLELSKDDDPLETLDLDVRMTTEGWQIMTPEQLAMQGLLNKGRKFMEIWSQRYGHASLKDSAVLRAAVEDLSIIATKEVEDSSLSAFQETSTRYMDFSKQPIDIEAVILHDPELAQITQDSNTRLMRFYTQNLPKVVDYIKSQSPAPTNKKEERALSRACEAAAFDVMRYFLPAGIFTKLGWTAYAREAERHISKMMSSPFGEVRNIGTVLKEEGTKVLPSLINHSAFNDYQARLDEDMRGLVAETMKGVKPDKEQPDVVLVDATPDLEDKMIAAMMYPFVAEPVTEEQLLVRVRQMSDGEKDKVFETYLGNRGEHDEVPKQLEQGELVYEITLDYGAYRDIQRNRRCLQDKQVLTTSLGFAMPRPEVLKDVGILEDAEALIAAVTADHIKVASKYQVAAQKMLPLGFRMRDKMALDPRELTYFVPLRSQPAGHISYRKIAIAMNELAKPHVGRLSKYIPCCTDDVDLGRLQSELRAENKIETALAEGSIERPEDL